MKRLKKFSYYEPTTVREASEILAAQQDKAAVLAGGTDLLVRMKRGDINPAALVNLKRIGGLQGIESDHRNELRIGAMTTISGLELSEPIRRQHPILSQAAGSLGSASIRNLATIGGNIGRASPASDLAPALIVLGARLTIEGCSGKGELGIENIFAGPGETTLSVGEIIVSFHIPPPRPGSGGTYLKLGRRAGGADCALVGVAAFVCVSDQAASAGEVRIALSAVGPRPVRAKRAEAVILSGGLTDECLRAAAAAASEETSPISDIRCSASYRNEMVRVLTYRAIKEALHQAVGGLQ